MSCSTLRLSLKQRRLVCRRNGRILLVIPFPRDTATVIVGDSSNFWAFNKGMSEA